MRSSNFEPSAVDRINFGLNIRLISLTQKNAMEEMHRFFMCVCCTVVCFLCCYSWGTRREQTYARDRINETAEWQTANQHAYLRAIVKWMTFVAHTQLSETYIYARECMHWIGLLPTGCWSGACVCHKFFSRLLCILLWRLLLVCSMLSVFLLIFIQR